MQKYNPSKIEKKWQKYWEAKKLHTTKDVAGKKENKMLLTEFAYPSGNLHLGHWYAFALPDIKARFLRMKGFNVLYPTGFDAFGLPAENAAIKNNIHPEAWTKKNIAYMTGQLKSMGATFDWSRKVSTIDPDYYKWTQWMFIQFYNANLAYRAATNVNWCPVDKTVLANEQVVNGKCDRCKSDVIQKELTQWMFKITEFKEELVNDLGKLDWQETAKIGQKNWIGRSEGASIKFEILNSKFEIDVFTTRPDTIFGCTFLVLAPEHGLLEMLKPQISNWQELQTYIGQAKNKSQLERQESKEKTGVQIKGVMAINPTTKQEIPMFVADYVLTGYGTGAIMAVPADDKRDEEFAVKFNLPIIKEYQKAGFSDFGKKTVQYKLHDWILSRQRYWGVPIPMISCKNCGYLPVPEKELPIKLPPLKDFKPAGDGRSPLAKAEKWLKTKCPKCGDVAERETDTMDTFVDSSWYFMRYADPNNKKAFASKEKMKKWLPVFSYLGGAEHTTMHLLYSRFFIKALHKLGYVDFPEPFLNRRNRGIILGPDNQKMSKSRGNVIDPDQEVKKYGADAVRMYLAFMGPYLQGGSWNANGIVGVYRFLNRVWNFVHQYNLKAKHNAEAAGLINKYVGQIGDDINELNFNTGVSDLMKLLNALEGVLEGKQLSKKEYETFLLLLAPYAPHMAEELWQNVLKNKKSIHLQMWPVANNKMVVQEKILLIVQINGKVRDKIEMAGGMNQKEVEEIVLHAPKIKEWLEGKQVKKIIYIPNKLINIVI